MNARLNARSKKRACPAIPISRLYCARRSTFLGVPPCTKARARATVNNPLGRETENMVRIVWEFTARADKIKEFENYFAGSGPWTALFRKNSGYHGTLLLRDMQMPRRYLTIDRWENAAMHRAMRERCKA